jgi:hypothetical protein
MATIKYWNGSAWELAIVGKQGPAGPTGPTGPAGSASLQRFRFVATGGETSLSGTDANGNTLAYTAGLEEVFLNGAALVRGQDYIATNGTSITSLAALTATDVVEILAWGVFNVANTISNTLIDAKGDILAGSAADTVSRLAVGANDTVLTADSSTATGLKWATPAAGYTAPTLGTTSIGSGATVTNVNGLTINSTTIPTSATLLTSGGALGTPTSGTLTNATGLPIVGGTTGTLSETRGGTNQTTYTTGDLLYASASNTLTKRGIGTTGQVLTVSGGVPAWATPSGSNSNWSLLNAGGTSLTGAATITISGISGREAILVLFKLASSANSGSVIGVRMNGDTAGNYYYSQNSFSVNTAYTPSVIEGIFRDGENFVRLGTMPDINTGQVNGHLLIQGCNTSGLKVFQGAGAGNTGTNNGQAQSVVGGYYNSSSTISSISLFSNLGNFDNGTLYVYATN